MDTSVLSQYRIRGRGLEALQDGGRDGAALLEDVDDLAFHLTSADDGELLLCLRGNSFLFWLWVDGVRERGRREEEDGIGRESKGEG